MKTLKYIFLMLLSSLVFASCNDDQSSDAVFADDELPKIYMSNWAGIVTVKLGEKINFEPLVSPSEGATFKWTLGGKTIAETMNLNYTVSEAGESELIFEVERNGVKTHRKAILMGLKPFEPKQVNKKVVAFVDTPTVTMEDIQWDNITHLVLSSAVVQADGSINYNLENKDLSISNLVNVAHNKGVYVMLDIAGNHTPLNAIPLYGSYDFYNVAIDPVKSVALIDDILKTVEENALDGINIYFDKAHDGAFAKPDLIKDFFTKLAEMVPEKSLNNNQKFLLSMSLYVGWTKDAVGTSIGMPRYDWYNVYAFAMEDLTPGPHSSTWAFTSNTDHWINTYGVAAEKMVPTVPAFALKYDLQGNTPSWGNLWQFTSYIKYSDLLRDFPNAYQANSQAVADGIFYDGIPAIQEKAAVAITNGYGGIGLWKAEYDSKETGKSLVQAMKTALGN